MRVRMSMSSKRIRECTSRYNIFPSSQHENDDIACRYYHHLQKEEEKEHSSQPTSVTTDNWTRTNPNTTKHSYHLPLSSNSPNETTVDSNNKQEQSTKQHQFVKLDPRAIFPWRHSSQPLPRLIPDAPEFTSQGGYIGPQMPPLNALIRGLCWINATGFLGGKIMNYASWKGGLEEGFKLAFAVAVQGLLMDVYRGM